MSETWIWEKFNLQMDLQFNDIFMKSEVRMKEADIIYIL